MDADDDGENETDNDDFWEELDSAKRAASKKVEVNPGKLAYHTVYGCDLTFFLNNLFPV